MDLFLWGRSPCPQPTYLFSCIPNKLAQDWKCQEALASVLLSGALYNKFTMYGMQLESWVPTQPLHPSKTQLWSVVYKHFLLLSWLISLGAWPEHQKHPDCIFRSVSSKLVLSFYIWHFTWTPGAARRLVKLTVAQSSMRWVLQCCQGIQPRHWPGLLLDSCPKGCLWPGFLWQQLNNKQADPFARNKYRLFRCVWICSELQESWRIWHATAD